MQAILDPSNGIKEEVILRKAPATEQAAIYRHGVELSGVLNRLTSAVWTGTSPFNPSCAYDDNN